MNSQAAASFWKGHDELPVPVRKLALKNFRLWLANPDYPSLHFKSFKENFWSVRVGDHYRAVGYYRTTKPSSGPGLARTRNTINFDVP